MDNTYVFTKYHNNFISILSDKYKVIDSKLSLSKKTITVLNDDNEKVNYIICKPFSLRGVSLDTSIILDLNSFSKDEIKEIRASRISADLISVYDSLYDIPERYYNLSDLIDRLEKYRIIYGNSDTRVNNFINLISNGEYNHANH